MAPSDAAPSHDQVTDAELEAFNQIVAALGRLPAESRAHVWETVGRFFRLAESPIRVEASRPREPPIATAGPSNGSSHFTEDRQPTPKQFLLDKKPRTDVDRIACLAYYLTHYRGEAEFKTIELSSLNTEAAQVKFSNAAFAAENAVKSGLLVPAHRGAKQLSALGEIYVSQLPDYERARQSMKEHRPFRKARRRKGSDE
jgi:hypothetical protein